MNNTVLLKNVKIPSSTVRKPDVIIKCCYILADIWVCIAERVCFGFIEVHLRDENLKKKNIRIRITVFKIVI